MMNRRSERTTLAVGIFVFFIRVGRVWWWDVWCWRLLGFS